MKKQEQKKELPENPLEYLLESLNNNADKICNTMEKGGNNLDRIIDSYQKFLTKRAIKNAYFNFKKETFLKYFKEETYRKKINNKILTYALIASLGFISYCNREEIKETLTNPVISYEKK